MVATNACTVTVVPTNGHQSSSQLVTQFLKWTVAETPLARASQGRCQKRIVDKSRWCTNHNHVEYLVHWVKLPQKILFSFQILNLRRWSCMEPWWMMCMTEEPFDNCHVCSRRHDMYDLNTWNRFVILINQTFTWIPFNNEFRQQCRTDMALAARNGVGFISMRHVSLLRWQREESQVVTDVTHHMHNTWPLDSFPFPIPFPLSTSERLRVLRRLCVLPRLRVPLAYAYTSPYINPLQR